MTTESMFQLIDRMAIARLKEFHYTEAGNGAAAALAGVQARDLGTAGDVYLWECLTRRRVPQVQRHLRFHDHGKAEGKWPTKTALEEIDATSVMEIAGKLALTHAQYWSLQTVIQHLKGWMGTEHRGTQGYKDACVRFTEVQREIDLLNQQRNDLIQAGDALLARMLTERDEKGATA